MFNTIMVPIDLAHTDKLDHGLCVAADVAKLYGASVVFVGVTASAPSAQGHNPKEYEAKLHEFAKQQSAKHGFDADARAVLSHDPAAQLDDDLAEAVDATGADLVIMSTHVPTLADHFLHSHGGELASRTNASVFLVRG